MLLCGGGPISPERHRHQVLVILHATIDGMAKWDQALQSCCYRSSLGRNILCAMTRNILFAISVFFASAQDSLPSVSIKLVAPSHSAPEGVLFSSEVVKQM
jgi:hypothetical protein